MALEHLESPDRARQSLEVPTVVQSPKLGERLNESPRGKELAKSSLDEYSKKSLAEALRLLSETLGSKRIPLNIPDTEAKIRSAIESVIGNPDIPNLAKQKFIKDITEKLGLLKDLDISDVTMLRNRRSVESLGVEPLELKGMF